MNKWIAAALGALFVLSLACGKDDPYSPTPAIIGVSPADVVAGRTYEVIVTGSYGNWNDTTTVDFGSGVTVDNANITVSGLDALRVPITVDGLASPGLRTVTVTTGGRSEELVDVFEVQPVLAVPSTAVPGQYAWVTFEGNQTAWTPGFAIPFLGDLDPDNVPTAIVGVDVGVPAIVESDRAQAFWAIDPFSPAGDYNAYVINKDSRDDGIDAFTMSAGNAVTAVSDGVASANVTLQGPDDVQVVSITGITSGSTLMVETQATAGWEDTSGIGVLGPIYTLYNQAALGSQLGQLAFAAGQFPNDDGSGYHCYDNFQDFGGGTYHFTIQDGSTVLGRANIGPTASLSTDQFPVSFTVTVTENGICP